MSYLLLIIFLILLLYKYNKACCFMVAFYPLLSMIGITDSINLFQTLSIISILLFILKCHAINRIKFPFYLTIILIIVSYIISNLMNIAHWPTSIAIIASEYIFTIVFWSIVSNKNNRIYFFRYFVIFISIICFYEVYEFVTQSNPLYDFYVNSSMFIGYDANRSEDVRFGTMRCHSLMRDVGAMGTICCMAFCIFFFHLKNGLKNINTYYLYVLIALCIICTFLTGTRTVILALIFSMIIISMSLNLKSKLYLYILSFFMIIIFIDYFQEIIMSFYDTQSVSGSSTYMRHWQYLIVMNAFEKSPLYGLGLEGTSIIINRYVGAFGLESAWFQILVNYGLLGVIAFSVSLLQGFYFSLKYKNIIAFTIVALFLLVKTMSSIPGIGNGYFIYIIIYLIKCKNSIYENRNNNNA